VDVIYTRARLGEATQILAVHPGRIKERRTEAVHRGLVMVDAKAFDEPGTNRDAARYWKEMWSAVTTAPRDEKLGVYGQFDRASHGGGGISHRAVDRQLGVDGRFRAGTKVTTPVGFQYYEP